MSSGVEYVVAAYGVMLFALLIYVVVAAMKRSRLSREAELLERLEASRREAEQAEAPSRNLESVDS
jgi:heme exporter protein D